LQQGAEALMLQDQQQNRAAPGDMPLRRVP
jgi:hypothetical protein